MSIAAALLAIQKKAPDIPKTGANPHFKARHVELDTLLGIVVPILNTHGVVLIQHPCHEDGHPALRTRLIHAETGETEESVMLLLAAKMDPQGQGSAITYARRYALMAALGLSADEDDDGNRASPPARASRSGDATPAQYDAIQTAKRALITDLGVDGAKAAYEQALESIGGEVSTYAQAAKLLERLGAASGVPA